MAHIVVYGAGGHGHVVADILIAAGATVAGFVDDSSETRDWPGAGLTILGDAEWLARQSQQEQISVALGVGDNFARETIANRCRACGIELLTAVHPRATVSRFAELGAGTVVMANAVINPGARIGEGAIVNTAAVVEHDCEIGAFAHLSPSSAMAGCAKIGRSSWLGIGAIISHGICVGSRSIIGAGAAVVRDIPDGVVAVGVPARVSRHLEGA